MPYQAARDPLTAMAASLTSPARNLRLVTPSDAADLDPYAKALWVFVPGDLDMASIRITPVGAAEGVSVDLQVPPGLQPLPPCQVRRIWATGTTAGIAIYALADR